MRKKVKRYAVRIALIVGMAATAAAGSAQAYLIRDPTCTDCTQERCHHLLGTFGEVNAFGMDVGAALAGNAEVILGVLGIGALWLALYSTQNDLTGKFTRSTA